MREVIGRAAGCLLGCAAGDAIGWPALYHRSIRLGSRRECLWPVSMEADRQQVLRFPLPFTVDDGRALQFCGTDDAEMAALGALMALAMSTATDQHAAVAVFDEHLVEDCDRLVRSERAECRTQSSSRAAPPCHGGVQPAP